MARQAPRLTPPTAAACQRLPPGAAARSLSLLLTLRSEHPPLPLSLQLAGASGRAAPDPAAAALSGRQTRTAWRSGRSRWVLLASPCACCWMIV